eukprot:m.139977 g.139977  ORF g.139977 m.139977 type:complete len:169 (-) comp30093_c0_seq5:128-634(-)
MFRAARFFANARVAKRIHIVTTPRARVVGALSSQNVETNSLRYMSNVSAGAGSKTEEHVTIIRPKPKRDETDDALRARLRYQSRKRGIKENDLLMGTFSSRFLQDFSTEQLHEYDVILNDHDNEWDMYHWMVGNKPLPEYLETSSVMQTLIEFAANKDKELRIELPPL